MAPDTSGSVIFLDTGTVDATIIFQYDSEIVVVYDSRDIGTETPYWFNHNDCCSAADPEPYPLKPSDGFWHPPYRWVDPPTYIEEPDQPEVKMDFIFTKLRARAPPRSVYKSRKRNANK